MRVGHAVTGGADYETGKQYTGQIDGRHRSFSYVPYPRRRFPPRRDVPFSRILEQLVGLHFRIGQRPLRLQLLRLGLKLMA